MNPAELARPEILALQPYASARALADRAGILLNANENPFAPPGNAGPALNRYPDPQPAELKARMAGYYGVDPEQLLITRGSDEGIDLLVRVFCRPGVDRVLVCPPCFGMYALSARIQNAAVVEVPLVDRGERFELDVAGIERAGPCRLVFLCSPNNPTGNRIEARTVLELARTLDGHGLVVLDEAYTEFQSAPSLAGEIQRQPNLVVLRTLSKAFALAGCRIGAVLAMPGVVALLRRILAPYPLPTPAVRAALAAFTPEATEQRQARLRLLAREKQRVLAALDGHPEIRNIWPGEANFVLVRANDGPGLVQAAAQAGIRLRDQSAQPGLEHAVRITVGSPDDNRALIRFLERWSI